MNAEKTAPIPDPLAYAVECLAARRAALQRMDEEWGRSQVERIANFEGMVARREARIAKLEAKCVRRNIAF